MEKRDRVLLLCMPFASVEWPQLGIGLLQAILRRAGYLCDSVYPNLQFAERVGLSFYNWMTERVGEGIFPGEWSFAASYFGADRLPPREQYGAHVGAAIGLPAPMVRRVLSLAEEAEPFLRQVFAGIRWEDYSVVGFSSTFEQNLPSLGLARLIKRAYPEKVVVFGGGNCDHPMGEALLRNFPEIDYVFSGEADESFLRFLRCRSEARPVDEVPGLVHRRGSAVVYQGPPPPVTDLDSLPLPDFEDYFTQLRRSRLAQKIQPKLPVETSRGCWWGQKHHCTFCGLNPHTLGFRAKRPERAFEEIITLARRYRPGAISAVDNILERSYFRTLLPRLAEEGVDLAIFFEVKANLGRDEVEQLSRAGVVSIQPGIESLSDHVLGLMDKGISALQNVQLLKWCGEFGVDPGWNLLWGFPGERPEDYQQMAELMQSLWHLPAPGSCGQIRIDRYSPYYRAPAQYGLAGVRPVPAYSFIYPLPAAELAELAYFHEADYRDGRRVASYVGAAREQVLAWQAAREAGGALTWRLDQAGRLLLEDTRANRRVERLELDGWRGAAYQACGEIRGLRSLLADLEARGHPVEPGELQAFLEELCRLRLMSADDGAPRRGSAALVGLGRTARDPGQRRYLALALSADPPALRGRGERLVRRFEPLGLFERAAGVPA